MRHLLLFLILLVLVLAARADPRIATIELTDGSVVRGEITAFVNATYAVESETLGRIQIPQSKVTSIRYDSGRAPSAAATTAPGPADFAELQTQMARDPEVMRMIEGLQSDPQIQALLADPEIQAAVRSGNLSVLLNDPRLQELLTNPKVRDITETVSGRD